MQNPVPLRWRKEWRRPAAGRGFVSPPCPAPISSQPLLPQPRPPRNFARREPPSAGETATPRHRARRHPPPARCEPPPTRVRPTRALPALRVPVPPSAPERSRCTRPAAGRRRSLRQRPSSSFLILHSFGFLAPFDSDSTLNASFPPPPSPHLPLITPPLPPPVIIASTKKSCQRNPSPSQAGCAVSSMPMRASRHC
jgi:hypothetical protein